jgi:hypothetical protein
MRDRFAVLDCGDCQSPAEVIALRSRLHSNNAALYYPWVRVADPMSGSDIALPPSGFVAGIFARNDAATAVNRAPANEAVVLASGFERTITAAEQQTLNSQGINCFKSLPGHGNLLWGARTISTDSDWKYVNVRRFIAYLEQSIAQGLQWVVFEPNNEPLWARVREIIGDFLRREWMGGRLLGAKPADAYFVRCDRTTMTQSDIDSGRLICDVGIAPIKPAEFVLLRIGQWTARRPPDS